MLPLGLTSVGLAQQQQMMPPRPLAVADNGWQSVRAQGVAQQSAALPANYQQPAMAGNPAAGGAYPQLNAPLYPSPKPNIPIWTGGSFVTNQALAPHEMLYPHTYRAMYPPFYHKVNGGWIVTPFGVRSHENWKLQGTMVTVKYRSKLPWAPHFSPPISSIHQVFSH